MEEQIAIMSRKDVHKAITNFIHNDLKICKEDIIVAMQKQVESILKTKVKELLDSKYFAKVIENTVMTIIKEGIDDGFYGRESFDKFIIGEIKNQIRCMVFDKYEVQINEKG